METDNEIRGGTKRRAKRGSLYQTVTLHYGDQ